MDKTKLVVNNKPNPAGERMQESIARHRAEMLKASQARLDRITRYARRDTMPRPHLPSRVNEIAITQTQGVNNANPGPPSETKKQEAPKVDQARGRSR